MVATEYFNCYRLQEVLGSCNNSILERLYTLYIGQLDDFITLLNSSSLHEDPVELASLAHRYKSSSRNVGADLLADFLEQLESSLAESRTSIDAIEFNMIIAMCNKTKESVQKHMNSKS
tara:strand:- start:1294 stop:1650 length:357 start_codon:yes stop_codon:yes gene_type:complete